MVSPLTLGPLLVAFAIVGLVVAAGSSDGVDHRFKRIARPLFDRFVDENLERKRLLQSAFVPETYRIYAAKTYLYAIVLAIAGAILGAYLLAGIVFAISAIGDLIAQLPRTMTSVIGDPSSWDGDLSNSGFLALVVGGGLVAGLLTGVLTYTLRWRLLQSRAEARRRRINESLPRTVAFLFALARGGMPFPKVMATLSRNRRIYGESAAEISVASREMELFGTDMINAIRRTAQRTPSEEFKTFGENLSSILQSGQSIPSFLHEQYDRYQAEAEERQEEILELLATIAEAYVTVLVAGTLFLMTILLVFGLTTSDTLWIIQLMAYLAIPLGNVGFMVFLDQRLKLLGIGSESKLSLTDAIDSNTGGSETPSDVPAADGGHVASHEENFARLDLHDRFERVQRVARQPLSMVFRNPTTLLYVTVPLALVVTLARLPTALTGVGVNVRVLDDLVIQAALFVMGTYAVVRFIYKRRLKRIEAATPELLERLASLNEAGMSIVESFDRVRGSDLGALSEEVERIWADVSFGANVEHALVRFGRRVRTVPVTRAVVLLTNAMRASGNIGSVLRIASNQSRADLRMKRQRRRQMLTYLVVIYVSFLVFLVIIIAVEEVLVPSLPSDVPTPSSNNRLGVDPSQFTRFGEVNKAAYTLVFFHTALIQAVLSGLIGGQIGEGSVKDGVKHATVMLGVAYIAFILLSSPVASVQFQEQFGGETVEVEEVTLSDGGYVVVYLHRPDGEVVGTSEYLPAGTHKSVEIELNRELPNDVTVVAIPHQDTNGNEEFDYQTGSDVDGVYPPGTDAVKSEATII
jgi:flagellar protein FlaJ